MKKTLQLRLTIIPTIAMLVAMGLGVATTVITNNALSLSYAENRVALSTERSSRALDDSFLAVGNAVNEARLFAKETFKTKDSIADPSTIQNDLNTLRAVYSLTASQTNFVCGYWIVLNPEYTGLTKEDSNGDGFFYVKPKGGEEFFPHDVTNVLKYDPVKDSDRVVWWYSIKDTGQPLWMEPYYNANVDQNMISYAVPFHAETGEMLGAVGIDLQFDEICAAVSKTTEFETENTFLLGKDNIIIYHPDVTTFQNGKYVGTNVRFEDLLDNRANQSNNSIYNYTYKGQSRMTSVLTMRNEMTYGVSVTNRELNKALYIVTIVPSVVYGVITVLLALALFFLVRHFLKPLKNLNEAVGKLESGDFNVAIEKEGNDEIGEITEHFNHLVRELRTERAALNALAFQDGLTGVKNTHAYEEKVKSLDEEIKNGAASFAVVMCDVDDLKKINDGGGHTAGDQAIRFACIALCNAFKHSPVFRVGGDEFVAIVEGADYLNREHIFTALKAKSTQKEDGRFRFSVGMANYEAGLDANFASVFARADENMYQAKKSAKGE